MSSKNRIEKDSLGEKEVGDEHLYGIQTLRSKENYPISGIPILPEIIEAYGKVKKSATQANVELGKMDKKMGNSIIKACEEVIAGNHNKDFVVDVIQAGAGTATNMNVNEVITNRVLEILGEKKGKYNIVSPNDHVNMSQSTNDTYPTTMRISIISQYKEISNAVKLLEKSFAKKAKEFKRVIKTGRTHIQDAVPMTLGQEFKAWSHVIKKLSIKLKQANQDLHRIPMGGTAVGTGINTHKDYASTVVKYLQENTGHPVKEMQNKIAGTQSQIEILEYASILKQIAIEVSRICSDLKLLSSGPNTGLSEINLPPAQPGSSIMPGKINPSITEAAQMTCYKVIGSETTVALCAHGGQLELNTNTPLMIYEVLNSISILTNALNMLREKCIDGITANKGVCRKYAYKSSSLVTILNPIIGYEAAAKLAKEQIKTKQSIVDIILDRGILTEDELHEILRTENLTRPK